MVNFSLHTEAVCLISFTGAEVFLSSLLQRLETDISMTLSALHCLKVEPFLRKRIAESLVPSSKLKANVSFQRSFYVVVKLNDAGFIIRDPYCKESCGYFDQTTEAFNTSGWSVILAFVLQHLNHICCKIYTLS